MILGETDSFQSFESYDTARKPHPSNAPEPATYGLIFSSLMVLLFIYLRFVRGHRCCHHRH